MTGRDVAGADQQAHSALWPMYAYERLLLRIEPHDGPQRYVVSNTIAPTDTAKFHELANQRLPAGEPVE